MGRRRWFNFPPEERRRWAFEDSRVRDAVSFRAAFEAGERAGREHNERLLRAILGDAESP